MSDLHHPPDVHGSLLRNSDPTTQNFVATARERLDALRAQEAALKARSAGLLESATTAFLAEASALKAQRMSAFREEAQVILEESSSLREDIRALEQSISAHNSLLNSVLPAVRTPPEILCEIFRWTSPRVGIVGRHRPVARAPWWLTHICRHWRAVARGDGALWCHIVLDTKFASHGTHESRYPLAALETQLELSAAFPLDIIFYTESFHPHDINLLGALVRHSNRWERLYIPAVVLPSISGRIRGNLTKLHHLQITPYMQEYPTEFRNIFAGAPQLREALLPRSPAFSLPWHQLTRLRVESEAEFLLEILPKLPNIVNWEITVIGDDTGMPSASDTNVVLPYLQQLVLHGYGDWFLHFLETPKLASLEVDWSTDSIPQFLRHSQCHVKALKLHWCFSELAALRELLRRVPTLSHLELDFCIQDDDAPSEAQEALIPQYFHAMKATGSSTPLCPQLTSMDVVFPGYPTPSFMAEGFCEMVESRWNLPTSMCSLMRVRISPDALESYSVWQRFDAMRRAGLDVNNLYADNDEEIESDSSA
ncbi:hypothetical protein DFH07DRAFT_221708 [Mycena maculata]|uniref:F-box domain-containing protein n=1 Tax=Mycena maculata TaxID=230809 RepID=A0AAD7HUD9_9AGAR|nr:hypothetical protein DFH07DRAFT_221708 [Mycena maculata]